MFFYFLFLLINLFGFINNSIIKNSSLSSNGLTNPFSLLSNQNMKNIHLKQNNQMYIKWHDIIFISILISLFILLLICLYYQHSLINFIFIHWSKTKNNKNKNNDDDTNEHIIILHQTLPLKNLNSMYLTVPKSSYLHH